MLETQDASQDSADDGTKVGGAASAAVPSDPNQARPIQGGFNRVPAVPEHVDGGHVVVDLTGDDP
eukprot:6135286-Prymnesium_polylepis.1